ncbi:NAD(P)/FAD-dependent oxidoreductase [Alloacidobacterium dinghuense]|uniref:NAD(P)/FAD-dependent oxidoreductase n=1 Tax=Alloacidobacterium dinghuense TaxID=2763107 RepID=A0A7G8BHN0_9BACT|nr:NAD(P)/FAD-dependent oxidoreductase [Alloacidobacterium dinghuense]QNI32050.1 NAD(P)/FAD-dependent oxidoreductase [Alloacidobacterium dinghuense]
MKVWDAIVVGAGPAGCACAYDLAAAGKSVLLLDKAEFPRMKACAGGLTMKTVRALRYSVAPVVRQTIERMVLEERDSSRIPVRKKKSICVMTERSELDAFCVAKTIEAGAVSQRVRGIDKIDEEGNVVAVTTQDEVIRGRFLVGADGVNSQVRRMTSDAGWFRTAFAIEANVKRDSHKEDLVFDFAPVLAGYGWVFPKRDHINVGLYSMDKDEKLNRSRLSAYIAQRFGNDAKAENFVGQHAGFGAAQHRVEKNRVFLIGDAGGFVDLLTGEGIYGAVVSGQAAAAAIVAELERNAAAKETFVQLTASLRKNLQIAERIAGSFYANPQRGFRAMKTPLLRSAILKGYADGLDLSPLVETARRVLSRA